MTISTYNPHRTTFENAVSAILVALTKTRSAITKPRKDTSSVRAHTSNHRPARRASKR